MKKILTLIAASALTFFGTSGETQARPHHGYHAPASTVYISGYRHGRPVYTEKYFVGCDRWGRPMFKYRTVKVRSGYPSPSHHCPPAYPSYYSGGHHSSGPRVTLSFGG